MLVMSRAEGERIIIDTGDDIIEVMFVGMSFQGEAKIGVSASKHIKVDREEIYAQKMEKSDGV